MSDYATATMRLTVPSEYQLVASGSPIGTSLTDVEPADPTAGGPRSTRTVQYVADRPARYLSVVISRFVPVMRAKVEVPRLAPPAGESLPSTTDGPGAVVNVEILSTPRMASRNRTLPDDLTLGGDSPLRGAYTATVEGLTSDPALYGKPTVLRTTRRAEGSAIENLAVNAVIDHVRSDRVKDSASARLRGVQLPSFEIPGLPFKLDPGRGAANFDFALRNDQLRGRWAINSSGSAKSNRSTRMKAKAMSGRYP